MSRVLVLVRHAEAASSHAANCSDAERPLTSFGRTVFAELVSGLQELDAIEHVFHSPRRRARETARLLMEERKIAESSAEQLPWLGSGFHFEQLQQFLRGAVHEHIAIVGHEPSMSRMASILCGRDDLWFAPGTMARISLDEACDAGRSRLLGLHHCRRGSH